MPNRQTPNMYFNTPPAPYQLPTQQIETTLIPNWVPILIGMSILALAIISLYALSVIKEPRKIKKADDEHHE